MVCSCSCFPPNNYKLTVIEWLYCLCVEIAYISSIHFVTFLESIAQWFCVLFQPILQTIYSFICTYLAFLIFGERSISEEQKASSLFESGSAVTWERAFRNLCLNSSANNNKTIQISVPIVKKMSNKQLILIKIIYGKGEHVSIDNEKSKKIQLKP